MWLSRDGVGEQFAPGSDLRPLRRDHCWRRYPCHGRCGRLHPRRGCDSHRSEAHWRCRSGRLMRAEPLGGTRHGPTLAPNQHAPQGAAVGLTAVDPELGIPATHLCTSGLLARDGTYRGHTRGCPPCTPGHNAPSMKASSSPMMSMTCGLQRRRVGTVAARTPHPHLAHPKSVVAETDPCVGPQAGRRCGPARAGCSSATFLSDRATTYV